MRAKQREIFANIPEFYVKDMCSWFSFVSVHNPGALKGLDVSVDYMLFSFLLNKETFLEDKISHRLKKLDPPFIFFSVRERGGILRILQSDWFREGAEFSYL